MTVLQPVAHWPKIDHAQAAGVWKTVAANINLIFITIGALKYPILTIIASPIIADFQYVVYKYFTQIINVTDILLQFFWGRILYSLDYIGVSEIGRMSFSSEPGGCFFGTGTTVAVFQRSGSLPSLSELLKIAVTGAANRCA